MDSLKPDGGVTARALFVEARLAELDRYLQTGLGAFMWQVPFRAGTTFDELISLSSASTASFEWSRVRAAMVASQRCIEPLV